MRNLTYRVSGKDETDFSKVLFNRLILISCVTLFEIVTWKLFFTIIPHLSFVPYNIRELVVRGHEFRAAVLITITCGITFGAPVFWSARVSDLKPYYMLIYPFLVILLSAAAYISLSSCVPMESLYDILGSPVLKWGERWELLYRFSALFCVVFTILSISDLAVSILFERAGIRIISAILISVLYAAALVYSYQVIVVNASTDNIIELMAGGGDAVSSLILALWLFTLGLSATFLSRIISGQFFKTLFYGSVIIITVPIGFMLFRDGTVSSLTKY